MNFQGSCDNISFSSPSVAFGLIQRQSTIVTAMAAAEPQLFYQNLGAYASSWQDVKIYCSNPSKPYSVFSDESLLAHVEFRPMFLSIHVRNHQNKPHVHYVPQHLSQWTSHLLQSPVDVFWGSCSLPNSRGFVSLGPGVCYEWEVLRKAKYVILEVNPHIPYAFGSTLFHIDRADVLLDSQILLPSIPTAVPSVEDRKIASWIGELVADGSTLQLGIGAIPNALVEVLATKKELGVHTEMINDAIYKLAEKGVITGTKKTLWAEKMIGSFAYGSKELYQFIHHNPMVELHPSSLVNDVKTIARNHRMVSINSAVEVDITGQVCSESLGHLELSGVGGSSETHIGAQKSRHGRGLIALHATTKNGESKIVDQLQTGGKVSISRNDVDTVVTEFGVAVLKGKTVCERAKGLISISHPDHRESLLFHAKKFGYI